MFLWNNRPYLNHDAAVPSWILLAFHLWFGDRHKLAWKALKRDSLLINLFFFLMALTLRRYVNCILPRCRKQVWALEHCRGRISVYLMAQWKKPDLKFMKPDTWSWKGFGGLWVQCVNCLVVVAGCCYSWYMTSAWMSPVKENSLPSYQTWVPASGATHESVTSSMCFHGGLQSEDSRNPTHDSKETTWIET